MPKNPLVEVFGFPISNMSQDAVNYRQGRLCPFNNPSGPNCTKSSATDPLGVCSIIDGSSFAITCPVRLRQDLTILADAANFFFPGERYIAITEARLRDKQGKSAGNVDIILVALNDEGKIKDFGAIEVQAVYISGNVKNVFTEYMKSPAKNVDLQWPSRNYPKPDYLSSSRKRLAPQLMFKGGIFRAWGKKMAVVVHSGFFEQLPMLVEVSPAEADLVWLIYDLIYDSESERFNLRLSRTVLTRFESALAAIATPTVGNIEDFVVYLESRIARGKLSVPPLPSAVEPTIEPLPNFNDYEE